MTRTCRKLETCRLSLMGTIPEEQREPLMCLECLLVEYVEGTSENGKLVVGFEVDNTEA